MSVLPSGSQVYLAEGSRTPAVAVDTEDERSFPQTGPGDPDYNFDIVYHKGQHNNNAYALSQKAHRSLDVTAASVALPAAIVDVRQSQQNDATIQKIHNAATE